MTDLTSMREAPSVEQEAPNFRDVFDREAGYVWNTLRRLGVRHDDLKDQSQEVFLTVHHLLPDFDIGRPMRPWLFAIAYRIAARYRVRSARQPSAASTDQVDLGRRPDEELADKEAQALVLEAMEAIEFTRRPVFLLAEIDQVPIPEIAHALSIPLNTAYSRLRIAREEFASASRALQRRERV